MITHLYTNGDSWTYGYGIEEDPLYLHTATSFIDQKKLAWPSVLAPRLGVTLTNEAEGGGSNERMVRMTCDFIQKYPATEYKNLLVILGWTDVSRREFLLTEDDVSKWVRFNVGQPTSSYENAFFSKYYLSQIDSWQRDYVKYVYSYDASCNIFFQQMFMMKHLLNDLGIKFIFFSSLPWAHGNVSHYSERISHVIAPNILNVSMNSENQTMASFCTANNIKMTSDGAHPMIDGHSRWAAYLYDAYLTLQNEQT